MTEASPFDKACELAQAIKQSQAFQRYLAAKQLLDRHPEYKQKVLKVRSVQMEVNRAHVLGAQLPADLLSELSQQLAEANQYPEIAEFFAAETDYVNMFQEIQNIINGAQDAELKD